MKSLPSVSLLIGLLVLTQMHPSFAQSASSATAPVAVRNEPRHHKVFENEWLRVLDVHIAPGDTSLYHIHETPSVFIVLTNVRTGSDLIREGSITQAPVTYGNLWFDGFYRGPRIHRVWNSDTAEFHVMDVELLHKEPAQTDSAWSRAGLQPLFDERPVRAYRFKDKGHKHTELAARSSPVLIVGLSGDGNGLTVNKQPFRKKGDYLFIPAGHTIVLDNKANTPAELAVFQLK